MSLVLAYLAVLGAFAARWLAQQHLADRPWLTVGSPHPLVAPAAITAPTRIGLGIFLASAGLLFSLLVAAYAMRVPGTALVPLDPRLLWLTTFLLAGASLALHGAHAAARRGREEQATAALGFASAAGIGFLGGQAFAWHALWQAGLVQGPDAAVAFFCLITALHGLHILAGLVALAWITARAALLPRPPRLEPGTALCTLYWDALLAVWLVLFGLLFRTPWSGLIDALCRPG